MRNPVAKNAWKANKKAVFVDRKKQGLKRACRKPVVRDGSDEMIYLIW